MRTTTLICAVLLLASCGPKPEPPKSPEQDKKAVILTPPQDDSSPIIISDGSIHIRHGKPRDHFRNKRPKSADIRATHYEPAAFGYGCDPSPDAQACNTPPAACAAQFQAGCPVDVNVATTQSWTLSLCETAGNCQAPGEVTVAWTGGNPGGYERIAVTSNDGNNLDYTGATSTVGAELIHHGAGVLQSATLTVTPTVGVATTYPFVCLPRQPCLTMAYVCRPGHNWCDP